jgi:hypothetical protein
MALYLCRRPNGVFSILNPRTKDDPIELLDEWEMSSSRPSGA